jgi:hypothetical protein
MCRTRLARRGPSNDDARGIQGVVASLPVDPQPVPAPQPVVANVRGRRFACSPAAVVALIVDDRERLLLLAPPRYGGAWGVVNGGLEAGETLLEGALREVR